MRPTFRLALVAGILAVPAAVVPAHAGDGSFSIPVGNTGNCVTGKTPTAQYNNGNPTTQPGEVYVNNCAT